MECGESMFPRLGHKIQHISTSFPEYSHSRNHTMVWGIPGHLKRPCVGCSTNSSCCDVSRQSASASKHMSVSCWGFPGGSDGKASACNAGDPGSIPGLGLENPMGGGTWWATVHRVAESGHNSVTSLPFLSSKNISSDDSSCSLWAAAVKTTRGRNELPPPIPYPQQTVNKIWDNLLCYNSN